MGLLKNEELDIQATIVQYLRLNRTMVFSVPNGSHFAKVATRVLMKKAGLLAGVSDLIVVQFLKVTFVEVKTKTGRQSDEQKTFQKMVEALGFKYLIWRSVSDAERWYRGGCEC